MGDADRVGPLSVAKMVTLRDGAGEYRVSMGDDGTAVVADDADVRYQRLTDERVAVVDATAPGTQAGRRRVWSAVDGDVRWVFIDGETYRFEVMTDGHRRKRAGHHGSLMAPMPATVIKVQVAPGDQVRRGDTLIILEAMKMELPVRASSDGIVSAVHCAPGQLVQPGIALIDIAGSEER
jgi:biotin carboxyl carrier protein